MRAIRFFNNHPLSFFIFLFLLHVFLRLPSFYTPILDVDETQFAGFAHVLMDGGLPYSDSLDTKPLGIYLFYTSVFSVFGRMNMQAVHAVTALLHFVIAIALYACFALYNKKKPAKLAAVFFVVFSASFIPKYLATSINAILIVPLVFSFLSLCLAQKQQKSFYDFVSGFFAGLAFLFKYTAGIQFVFFAFWQFYLLYKKQQSLKISLKRLVLFGVGVLLPLALHTVMLWRLGVLADFWQWSILGSGAYVSQGSSTIVFWQSFLIRFGSYVLATLLLWLLALRFIKQKEFKVSVLAQLAALWFALSLIPVFVGARFYGHYFLHVLPSLCVVAAFAVSENLSVFQKRFGLSLLIVPSLLFFMLRVDHKWYLSKVPDDHIYEQQEIGEALRQISQGKGSVFVWGFATGIQFWSELRPASRFLWADLLTGRTPGPEYARQNQEQEGAFKNLYAWSLFWKDLQDNRPEYFVDTSPANIHDYGRFPISDYPELHKYIRGNYVAIGSLQGVVIYQSRESLQKNHRKHEVKK